MAHSPDNVVPITPGARSAAKAFSEEHDRELLTILFTDLVDSTRLQSERGNVEAARLIELHRDLVRDELSKYDAREIEWAGDSCLAVFTRPSDGIIFSLRMLAKHRAIRETEPALPHVRVGLHLGEIVVRQRHDGGKKSEDLFGLQVSEAARIMSVARADQIFCTRGVSDSARGVLHGHSIEGLEDIAWRVHGAYRLKGSEHPVEISEVGERAFAPLIAPETNDKCQRVYAETRPARNALWSISAGGAIGLVLILVTWFIRDELPLAPKSSDNPVTLAPQSNPVSRVFLSLPFDRAVAPPGRTSYSVAISPDGMLVAYVAEYENTEVLAIRPIDDFDAELLAGTEGARNPFFSPDGKWIGFFTVPGGELKKVSVHGGAPITVCKAPLPLGAYWSEDGTIIFASRMMAGLSRVSEAGGEPELLTSVNREAGELVHMFPAPLPNPNAVLITTGTTPQITDAQVQVLLLNTGERKTVAEQAIRGRYVPTGHIVYVQQGAFMAVPFSAETLSVTGPPYDVTEKRMVVSDWTPLQFEFSMEGSLVFVPQYRPNSNPRPLFWVDRDGSNHAELNVPPQPYAYVRLSPDDAYLAALYNESDDIWIVELARGSTRNLTDNPAKDSTPVWSPDGKEIAFSSNRDTQTNIYIQAMSPQAKAERVFFSTEIHFPDHWIAEGPTIFYRTQTPETGIDIGKVILNGPALPEPVASTRYYETAPAPSNDGELLAYVSDESGRDEIHLVSLRNPDVATQATLNGGIQPMWNPTRKEIIYRDGTNFAALGVAVVDGRIQVSEPKVLFEDTFWGKEFKEPAYDISSDGERLLVIEHPEEENPQAHARGTELVIVNNWFETLRKLEASRDSG